ncbi:MAG TPA: hemerythrin domain-containing protein [Bacilli bacterium]
MSQTTGDVAAEDVKWEQSTLSELIDHIVNTHHAYLNKQMPIISELLTTLLRHHWFEHQELLQAHTLFHQLKAELEQHMIKEETKGFVLIKAYEKEPGQQLELVAKTINAHINEHDSAEKLLAKIREATNNYHIPSDVCDTYNFTFRKIQEMEKDLRQHIHLEDDILFPRMQALLK